MTLCYDLEIPIETLDLTKGMIYSATNDTLSNEAEKIVDQLKENQKIKADRHTYGALIYALRNKLVHEMVLLNSPINFQDDLAEQLPHLSCKNIIKEGKLEFSKWTLNIPETFIVNVLKDVVGGYLDECQKENKAPFDNNSFDRTCYSAWYD